MKKLTYLLLIVFFYSCQTEEIYREIPDDEDLNALHEMKEAYELAYMYNDALDYYTHSSFNEDSIHYYDALYHVQDSIYSHFHEIYSHLNAYDDHHHEINPPAHRHHEDRHMDDTFFGGQHIEDEDHEEDAHHEEEEHSEEGEHHEEEEHSEEGEHHEEEEHEDEINEIYSHTMNSYYKMLDLRHKHLEFH